MWEYCVGQYANTKSWKWQTKKEGRKDPIKSVLSNEQVQEIDKCAMFIV